MKFFSTLVLFAASSVLAAPQTVKRDDDIDTVTDTLLFTDTLPEFIAARDAEDPSTLDWTSDGCTDSPDNPLGFPFTPACYRHDFGYQNYRDQDRFTEENKAKIDSNFLSDLDYQCEEYGQHVSICDALAEVYYWAVREFGGQDASKRSDSYDEALAYYNKLVDEAYASGELPDAE